jgi:hypothetical protein
MKERQKVFFQMKQIWNSVSFDFVQKQQQQQRNKKDFVQTLLTFFG